MNSKSARTAAFTLVEIMMVVVIVGLLSSLAVPALLHVKRKSEDTLALNTLRQFYDARELYFLEDGAGKPWANVPVLVKAGYASHSLDVATQHNIGAWTTPVLRRIFSKPGTSVTISEEFHSGNRISYGRKMTYPAQP